MFRKTTKIGLHRLLRASYHIFTATAVQERITEIEVFARLNPPSFCDQLVQNLVIYRAERHTEIFKTLCETVNKIANIVGHGEIEKAM